MTLAHSAQAPLSGAAAAVVGLVAFVVVVMNVGWRVVRHGTVMAHEGAHAVLGSLLLWLAATLGAVAVGGAMLVLPA